MEKAPNLKGADNGVLEASKKDSDSLLKELIKEVCGKGKREVNWESVKKLQRLTFSARKKTMEDIDIIGNNVVSAIVEKFPFFDNEAERNSTQNKRIAIKLA